MAKISNRETGLSLEVCFATYMHEWIFYYFFPCWRGKPVFNPAIIKPSFRRAKHPRHALSAENYQVENLVATIRGVLDSGLPDEWSPHEPAIVISIIPPGWYSYYWQSSARAMVSENRSKRAKLMQELRAATAAPKKPRDEFEIELAMDAYVLAPKGEYFGPALKFKMIVERQQLEKFHDDLKVEYKAFCKRHGLLEIARRKKNAKKLV
jgi:hypothetical protein